MGRLVFSFRNALRGVLYVFENENNARIHLLFAIFAFVLGLVLQISGPELAAIFFAVVVVFVAEITNTAVEKTLDLVEPNHHPQVKLIKDMAAGGVLVAAVAALIIGVVIFTPHIVNLWAQYLLF
ncbi:MAG TPA: diacylglycerol kinase family protein [Candidatus Saccharimonas sp.]|nr:diacylglycerol kinase family protein [Candidatus Saccharimonas sp.]